MCQHKKNQHSELLTTGGGSPLSQSAAVNTKAQSGQPSTPSQKTESTPTSTTSSMPKSSNLTLNVSENDLIAAGILTSVVPTLLAAKLIRKLRHKETGEVHLVFPSTLWTEELRLRKQDE